MKRLSIEDIAEAGYSLAALSRRSGASHRTLRRIFSADPSVRPDTAAKVRRAWQAMRAEADRRFAPRSAQ